jgi:uncharacterized membrane protein
MGKGRLEAFSDGVIAVALTIMVLDLKTPTHHGLEALREALPTFLVYILSYVYVAIYWNNHHHLLHAARQVSGMTLWANLHLLFWITLIPFVTGWAGESWFETWAVASYGMVLLMAAIAWQILVAVLVRCHGPESPLGAAIGRGAKEWVSTAMYVAGITIAVSGPWLGRFQHWAGITAFLMYAVVAVIWFVPDRRIEAALRRAEQAASNNHA